MEIQLLADLPEKYREAVMQSAQLCAVKKHIEHAPVLDISQKTEVGPAIPAVPRADPDWKGGANPAPRVLERSGRMGKCHT